MELAPCALAFGFEPKAGVPIFSERVLVSLMQPPSHTRPIQVAEPGREIRIVTWPPAVRYVAAGSDETS